MQWKTIGRLAAPALMTFIAFPLTAASATDDAKTVNQEILEILRQEGTIDDEKYRELAAKEAAEAEEDPTAFTVKYKNALNIDRNDGLVKIKLGGRIQADFATIHPDDDLDKAVSGGDGEGTEFRRARLYMSGEIDKRIIFKAQYDFTPSTTAFNDVYIGMKGLGPVFGTVKVGNFKQPIGLEELTSSKNIMFMERAQSAVFNPARDFGIAFANYDENERFTWALGIFAPSDSHGMSFTHRMSFDITGRVTALPCWEDDGGKLLHLGFAVHQQFRDDISTRFRERPEAHLAQRYIDTGNFSTDNNTILNAEMAWVQGPFSLQAEWTHGFMDVRTSTVGTPPSQIGGHGTSNLDGGYVHASYFLTGEHRNYDRKTGTFGRISPLRPFDPQNGDWGAFQLAGRLSYLNANDDGLYGGKGTDVTAGINWFLYSQVRLTANYVYGDIDTGPYTGSHGGDIHIFQARAQIEF